MTFSAALALSSPLCLAALPLTSAGAADPTFNGGAPVVRNLGTTSASPVAILADKAGRFIVVAHRANPDNDGDGSITYVARHREDGTTDASFATGGTLILGDAQNDVYAEDAVIAADGRIWLAGSMSYGANLGNRYSRWIARVNADGTPDSSFGNGGQRRIDCAPARDCYYYGIVEQADHRMLVVGNETDYDGGSAVSFVDRYLPDGGLDASFGNAGRLVGPAFAGFYASKIALDASGRAIVAGARAGQGGAPNHGELMRFMPDGTPDATFGSAGVVSWFAPVGSPVSNRVVVQQDGRVLVAGYSFMFQGGNASYAGLITRFMPDGAADTGFGTNGFVAPPVGYGASVGVQSDGRIVFAGTAMDAKNTLASYKALIARFTPSGVLDSTFGSAGVVQLHAGPAISRVMLVGADDRIAVAASAAAPGASLLQSYMLARVIGTETTTSVVEFYNTTLNHYFITADPNEAGAIDQGAAGPGWTRTGFAWKSGGPARVCRFYGSPDVDPATQKRKGPNGHFYTISAEECALVKEDAGWKFESYDFSGWPKQADGSCAAGTVAVKRAYNNRFAMNDSNHRYTTSDDVYAQMVAAGWSGEGVVFCAPM